MACGDRERILLARIALQSKNRYKELMRAGSLEDASRIAAPSHCLKDDAGLAAEEDYIKKNNIGIITYWDEKYPPKLKEISQPPLALYYKGAWELAGRQSKLSIAIVGSRSASAYGLAFADRLGYELACNGAVVISGMALGIDTAAHRGALKAKGGTVAVLGSGFGHIYPKTNRALFDKIAQDGLVLTEYPVFTRPTRFTFPYRNRIISGLSDVVVVAEAGERSGALITARYAAEQGKDVYALPGNINNPYSVGANSLISDGAYPIISLRDFFMRIGIETVKNQKETIANTSDTVDNKILNALRSGNGLTLDEVASDCGLEARVAAARLALLELNGAIQRRGGLFYPRG